jgi:hypothetical protein
MLFGADAIHIVNSSITISAFKPTRSHPHHRHAAHRCRMQDIRKARRLGDVTYFCPTCNAAVVAIGGLVVRQGRIGSIACGCGTPIEQWTRSYPKEK